MMTLATPTQSQRSAATSLGRGPDYTLWRVDSAPSHPVAAATGVAASFPDLSDPAVRALPIAALALAWAVIERFGGDARAC